MSKSSFFNLYNIIRDLDYNVEDELCRFKLDSHIDEDNLRDVLIQCDYEIDLSTLKGQFLNISLDSSSWLGGVCPIFPSWEEFYDRVEWVCQFPDDFYILESDISSFDEKPDEYKRIEVLINFRKLLARMSDHCVPEKGSTMGRQKLFFLIDSESGARRFDIIPTSQWEWVKEIRVTNEKINSLKFLMDSMSLEDCQSSERRSVMRTAFSDVVGYDEKINLEFRKVVECIEILCDRYKDHHEIFINKFNVSEIIKDINDKNLQYTSKISEIVSSGQTKALAIPGALVAISAVLKVDGAWDAIGVLVGIYLTAAIIHKALSVHNDSFVSIKDQILHEFSLFEDLNENTGVRERAEVTRKSLNIKVDAAIKSVNFIKQVVWSTVVFTSFWMVANLGASF
ncbi:MAG: hypothetical protein OIF55_19045 [Amphritea sp.]|nr:hypothetical protein [Amphritea sp.]